MKALVLLGLILVVANSINTWDNWHNVPTTWVPPANSSISTLAGWTRNTANATHFSGLFSNFTQIFTQYLYWNNDDPNLLLICGPKYYISSEYLCKVDPYFQTQGMDTYCIPNYFNHPQNKDVCQHANKFDMSFKCCYGNSEKDAPSFLRDFYSLDNYPVPLF